MMSSTETAQGLKSDQIELVDKAIIADESAEPKCQQSSPGSSTDGKSGAKGGEGKEQPPVVPFLKLFAFADRLDCLLIFLGASASMAVGAGTAGGFLLFGSMVDTFGKNTSTITTSELVHQVSKVALKYLYVGVAVAAAAFVEKAAWVAAGLRQSTRIRTAYLTAVLRQDVSFYDTEVSTGEVVARLSGDTLLIQEAISEKMGTFLQYMSVFVFGYVIAYIRGWKLALVTTSNLPLVFCAGAIFAAAAQAQSKGGSDAYGEAGKVVEQVIGAMRTVVSFNGEKKAVDDYDQALVKGYKASVAQSFFSSMGMLAVFFVVFGSYALALWYSAKLVVHDGYSGGDVLVVVFGILQGGVSLGQAAPIISTFQLGQQAAYKMFSVIQRTPPIDSSDPEGASIPSLQGHLEFRQVTFCYPSRPGVQIFSDLCLSIPAGTIAAVVGESGGGKSTLISLLERFYDPQSGSVLVDGTDVKTLNLRWWRQQVALVSQEPVLFGTTISENIAYGNDEATMEDIQRAAQQANAASFIQEMPEGYGTHVGEHGTRLSGGQKQRVAIARAILKNPRILLLDEATSALDSRSEVLVQEALDRFMKNRTTVVVAHRLSTIRHADFIAVIQRGIVTETGTHAELLNLDGGAYRQLVRLQELKKGHEEPSESGATGEADEASPAVHNETDLGSGRRSFSHKPEVEAESGVIKEKRRSWWWSRKRAGTRDEEKGWSEEHKEPSFFRLATLLDRPAVVLCVVGCIAAAIFGATNTLFALLLSRVVGALYEPDPHRLQERMDFWASMMAIMAAGIALVAPTRIFTIKVMGLKLVRQVRRSMFAKIVRQEISWFDSPKNSSGAISSRLATDAALVEVLVGDVVSLAVQNLSTIIAALVIGFTANWLLTLVVLALTPFLGFFGYAQLQQLKAYGAEAKALYEDASELACNAVGSIRTVASFCAEDRVVQAFQAKCQGPQKRGINQGFGIGLGQAFAHLSVFGSYALSFYYGSQLVKDGKTTFEKVFTVFLAISLSAGSISAASGSVPDVGKVKTAVRSIFGILDQTSKIDATSSDGKTLPSVRGQVEYQQVNFRYPGRPHAPIFKNLSLTVPAGKSVALVGASGSGKSTMLALLERFYDPDSGSILLDGVNIRELQITWLRQQLGLVSQEPVIFDDTIESNIVYGCHNSGGEDNAVAQQEIEAAAIAANAHSFISALPQGYSTRVGERGIQLSGGQKQRVAIARAVIRNPKVLLLDEATSALDAESEKVVQDALDRIMVDRTTIVIAHRFSTIQNAHLIAVVKDGHIVEQGRHEDLISKPHGAYAALANLHPTHEVDHGHI